MTDYKAMYLRLLGATERALDILIAAQREAEELYINAHEGEVLPLPARSGPAEEPPEA